MDQTRRMLGALLSDPAPDDLYDYAAAIERGADVAALFPDAHQWVEAGGRADPHYRALLALLEAEHEGSMEAPPGSADLRFDYLAAAQPPAPVLRLELGRLWVRLSEQLIEAFRMSAPPGLQYAKAVIDDVEFSGQLVSEVNGIKVSIAATPSREAPAKCCMLTFALEIAGRAWPRLGGIPIELRIGDAAATTLLTDPFGRVRFPEVVREALADATIVIGAVGEFEA